MNLAHLIKCWKFVHSTRLMGRALLKIKSAIAISILSVDSGSCLVPRRVSWAFLGGDNCPHIPLFTSCFSSSSSLAGANTLASMWLTAANDDTSSGLKRPFQESLESGQESSSFTTNSFTHYDKKRYLQASLALAILGWYKQTSPWLRVHVAQYFYIF